jgi:hypothetical protein
MVGTISRVTGVVLVVLLVAMAGCSGTDITENTATPTTTATADPVTPESVGNSTANDSYQTGPTLTRGEVTTQTADSVATAGSYTLYSTALFDESGPNGRVRSRANTTTRVDLVAGRGLETTNRSTVAGNSHRSVWTASYTAGNTTSWRLNTSQGVSYGSQNGTQGLPPFVSPVTTDRFTQNYTGLTGGFDWERNGTARVGTLTAARYTIAGVADPTVLRGGPNATLSNVTGTLLVDRNGVVRRSDLRYTVITETTRTNVTLSTTLTDVGATTVTEPAWVSETS